MKIKKILFLTTGVFNKSQGGSGQFNEKILEVVSHRNVELKIVSVSDSKFFESNNIKKILPDKTELTEVKISRNESALQKFFNLLYPLQFKENILEKKKIIDTINLDIYDLIITYGLGWALVLPGKGNRTINFFGDPLDLIHSKQIEKVSKVKKWIISLTPSRNLSNLYFESMKKISTKKNFRIYTFLPQEKIRLKKCNIEVSHVNWFTYSPNYIKNYKIEKSNILTLGFMGDRHTTYSSQFVDSTLKDLKKLENNFNFVANFNIIGKNWDVHEIYKKHGLLKNFQFNVLGFVENLSLELTKIDYMFYIENYSIGVRTRILTSMSYKCPIITHISAMNGIPELKKDINAIIINDIRQLGVTINMLETRKFNSSVLVDNAYNLWREKYSEQIFTKNISQIIFSSDE